MKTVQEELYPMNAGYLFFRMAGLALIGMILICPAYSAEWEAVSLSNPSFEDGDRLPKTWRTNQDGDAEVLFIWSREYARTGSRSLYIKNEGPRHGWWEYETELKFEPGATYRASVWYRTRLEKVHSKGKDHGRLAVRILGTQPYVVDGKKDRWQAAKAVNFSPTGNEWQVMTFEFTPPPEVKSAVIWLWSLIGVGDEVWFDDFSLEIKRKE